MGILRENRCASKAKEHGTRKGVLDCQEHTAAALLAATRHTAVALVYDEHHALVVDFCNGGLRHMVLVCDTTHLLYRGDDKILVLVVALQHTNEVLRVLRVEHIIVGIGKSTIFVGTLRTQLDAVEQEYYFVGITGLCYELCRLE